VDRLRIVDGIDRADCGHRFLFDEVTTMRNQWRKAMMGLPSWLRSREGDFDMTHEEPTVPPIAKIEKKPLPFHIAPSENPSNLHMMQYVSDDPKYNPTDEANVVVQAHQFVEQWKLKDAAQQKTIERLESEKAELESRLKSEQRKSGLLELDIAERDNTIQTLQSDVLERRRLLGMLKDINDKTSAAFARLGVTGEPKKERNPNGKTTKAKRQETSETTPKDRAATEKPDAI
jgi:hypothetical protein